jgi:hypothetical protein
MAERLPQFEMPEGTESAATSSETPRYRPDPEIVEVIVQTKIEHPELDPVRDYLPYVE